MASDRLLRWLCWALIGFVVVSAVMTLTLSQNPLLVGVVLQILNLGQVSSLVVGIVSGFAVPIWAFLLARGTRQPKPESVAA